MKGEEEKGKGRGKEERGVSLAGKVVDVDVVEAGGGREEGGDGGRFDCGGEEEGYEGEVGEEGGGRLGGGDGGRVDCGGEEEGGGGGGRLGGGGGRGQCDAFCCWRISLSNCALLFDGF